MSNHTKRWKRYQASGYLNESPVPETIAISSSSWPGETPADTRRVDEVAVFDSEFLRPRNDSTSRLAVDITAYALQRDQMKIINTEQTKTELPNNLIAKLLNLVLYDAEKTLRIYKN
ncbi:hypothetical protein GQX74_012488 [Glossina fuscipes]|nr:hypothetical protein GQX74_012488 [Glossina fuscipes]